MAGRSGMTQEDFVGEESGGESAAEESGAEESGAGELGGGARLGRDLRALRKNRGLTLLELAAKIGRSIGFVSQAERGLSELGIADLSAIAKALDAPLSWFLVHDDVPEAERGHVVRWGQRRRIGSAVSGHAEELLSPDLGGSFEMVRCVFEPGAEGRDFITRQTEETGYLISGELDLWIGEKFFRVFAGDSFRINGEPARWRNPGAVPTEVIWVISPPTY